MAGEALTLSVDLGGQGRELDRDHHVTLGRGDWPRQGMLCSLAFSLFSQDLIHNRLGSVPLSYVPVPKVVLISVLKIKTQFSLARELNMKEIFHLSFEDP